MYCIIIHSFTHGAPLHGRDLLYNHCYYDDVDSRILLWDYDTEADVDVDADIDDGDNKGSDNNNRTHADDTYWY